MQFQMLDHGFGYYFSNIVYFLLFTSLFALKLNALKLYPKVLGKYTLHTARR